MIRIDRGRVVQLLETERESWPAAEGFLRALADDERAYFESGTTPAGKLRRIYEVKLQTARNAGIELTGTEDLLANLDDRGSAEIRIFYSEDRRYTYVAFTDEEVMDIVACFAIGKHADVGSAKQRST